MVLRIILDNFISIANLKFVFWFFKISHCFLPLMCAQGEIDSPWDFINQTTKRPSAYTRQKSPALRLHRISEIQRTLCAGMKHHAQSLH